MPDGDELNNSSANVQTEAVEASISVPGPIKIKKNHLGLWITGAVVMILVIVGGMFYVLQLKAHENSTANNTPTIKTQKVDTSKLSPVASSFIVENDKVVINGQLQANQNLVITPTAQPGAPVTGLVYLDKTTNELKYYNGTSFITLADKAALASLAANVNGANGVTSLQGSTGALNLLGTGGLSVSASGTTISLKLPQNLATTASPIFNALTLSSLNCTGNQNGGVLTTNASGNIICGDDDATPPGGGITSLNGQIGGVQTFANDTNITISSAGDVHTLGWSGTLSVARGGTGAANAAGARTNLGAAASGANSDITSLSGLTTPLSALQGGTGINGSAAGNGTLLIGNGSGYSLATLTQGAGINIANGAGSISIASTLGTDVDLTTEVSGILPVGNGGSGANTLTANGVLIGNGASPISSVVAGGSGLCLLSTAGTPTWSACPGGGGAGVNTIGTLDSQSSVADGAQIIGTTLYLQSADPSFAGLVNTTTQSFAGDKTFTGAVAIQGSSLTLGASSSVDGSIILANAANGFTFTLSAPNQTVGSASVLLPDTGGVADTVCLLTLANCLGGSGGANTSLSNLSSVAINTSLLPATAIIDLGSNANAFRDLYLGGTTVNNFQITGTASAAQVITLPDETGTICLQNATSCGFASASGSGAYVQFAPVSAQVDSNTDPASSTIFIIKDNNNGDIVHIEGTGTSGTNDAFVIKATGDTYFRSLSASDTAFQVQNAAGNDVLNISTTLVSNLITSPDSTFDGITDLSTVSWQNVGDGVVSAPTISLNTDLSYDANSYSMEVDNAGNGGGVIYPFALTAGQDYTMTIYARKLDTKTQKIKVGYYTGSNLSSKTEVCTSPNLTNGGWTQLVCYFTALPSGQSGIYARVNTTNAKFVIDNVILQTGAPAPLSNGRIELNTTTFENLNSTEAFQIQDAISGTKVMNIDTVDGKLTLQAVNNVDNIFQVLNANGDQIFNLNAGDAGTIGKWTLGSSLPNPGGGDNGTRDTFQAANYTIGGNTYAYIIGGQGAFSGGATTVLYSKLTDSGASTWITDSSSALPAQRYAGGTVAAKGYIYYLGGCDNTATSVSTVYYSKINTDGSLTDPDPIGNPGTRWLAANSLNSPRCNTTALYYSGYIYVFGGEDLSGRTNTVEIAKVNTDGSLGSWTTSANTLPLYLKRLSAVIGPSPTANSVRIYALGGFGGSAAGSTVMQDSVYYADVSISTPGAIGAWSTSANHMPAVRINGAAAIDTIDGISFLYYIGGQSQATGGISDTLFTSTLDTSSSDSVGSFNTTIMYDSTGNFLYRDQFGFVNKNHIFYILAGDKYGGTAQRTTYYVSSNGSASHADINGSLRVTSGITDTGAISVTTADNVAGALQISNSTGTTIFSVDTDTSNVTIGGSNQAELHGWQTTNSLPAQRSRNGAAILNGYIYSISGESDATVYYAKLNTDGTTGAWSSTGIAALPDYKDNAGVVTYNGYIYVIGGYDSGSGASPTNSIYFAKPATDGTIGSWRTSANNLSTAVASPAVSVANGYVYVAGGATSSSGGAPTTPTQDVQYAKLNPDGTLGTFSVYNSPSTSALPAARMGARAAVANGYLYVSGGANSGASATATLYYAHLNSDGSVDAWSTNATNLSSNRAYHTSVIANGYLYVLGGTSSTYGTANNTDSVLYGQLNGDGSISEWFTNNTGDELFDPVSDGATAMANGYIYIIGSTGPSSVVMYTSTQRVSVGGSLDLVGANSLTLSDAGGGGQLTAGNTTIIGTLDVRDAANFTQSLSVTGDFTASGLVLLQNSVDSASAFQVQDSAGTSIFNVDTSAGEVDVNGNLLLGTSNTLYANNILQTAGGNDVAINAGSDAINFTAGGITFAFPTTGAGTQEICTDTGNCAGSGGGVTGSGTSDFIPKFTGANTIGDSLLSDDGTTLYYQGLEIAIGTPASIQGVVTLYNASNANTVSLQSGVTAAPGLMFTLPTADGTPNQCLQTDGSGALSFANCVGGSGGSSGVSSLNTLTGALTIAGTSDQIIVTPSGGNTLTLSTPQNINTTSSPQFVSVTGTTSLLTPLLDANSAAVLNIGTTNATAINLNQNVVVASAKSLTTNTLDTTTATALVVGNATATAINLNQDTVIATNKSLTANGSALFKDATSSATAFQVQNTSNNEVLTVDTSANQVLFGKVGTLNGKVVLASTGGGSIALSPASDAATETITVPTGGGTLCTTVNVATTCIASGAAGTVFLQGGNSFSAAADLGTNDSNVLNFRTNNATKLTLGTTGNLTFALGITPTISGTNQTASNVAGDNMTIQAANGNGTGAGGTLTLQGGNGGSGTSNTNGGSIALTGGVTGGSTLAGGVTISGATGGTCSFCTGGAISLQGGTAGSGQIGGAVSVIGGAATGAGSSAGAVSLTGGTGGSGTPGAAAVRGGSSNSTSAGGAVTIQGGANTANGTGGGITIAAGVAGPTSTNSGAAISITAGDGGSSSGAGSIQGGAMTLQGGTGGTAGTGSSNTGGVVTIQGGTGGNSSNGGAVTISGGTATGGGNTVGGLLTLQGGAPDAINGSHGGGVTIAGRNGSSTGGGGDGGAVTITGGNGQGTGNRTGGNISLTAGNGVVAGAPGNISITAGNGALIPGGTLNLQAGTGGTASAGGAITISGGTAGTTGTGGAITLQAGAASASAGSKSGALTVATQNGVNGSGATAGGLSGDINITVGDAGNGSGTNSTGGVAGTLTVSLGDGGNGTGTGVAKVGGAFILQGGAGGNASGSAQNSAAGSAVTINLGAGGNNTNAGGITTSGSGGTFTLQGGTGGNNSSTGGATAGAGSAININGGTGGNATGASGTNNGGNGGTITLTGGAGGSATSGNIGASGNVILQGGYSFADCAVGNGYCGATITAGAAAANFAGAGQASIIGGTVKTTVNLGVSGAVSIASGTTFANSTGAITGILTGDVNISSGSFTFANLNGTTDAGTTGNINIVTGTSTTPFGGQADTTTGNISINVGAKTGAGTAGSISIGTTNASSGINIGNSAQTGSIAIQGAANTSGVYIQNANNSRLLNVDTSTTQNLVLNGSFESTSVPSSWTALVSATLSHITTSQIQGNRALQIATTTSAGSGAKYTTGASFLTSSTQYTISFWAKLSSGSMTTFEYGRADDGSTQTNCATAQTLNTTWTYFSCTFTTGTVSGTPNIYFIQTDAPGAGRNIILDSVQLEAGASATTFNPGGQLQLLGTINSPVTIRPKTDSSQVFQVQDAGGTNTLLGIDTTGNGTVNIQGIADTGIINIGTTKSLTVTIGKSGGTSTLTVHGSATFNGTFTVNGHIISGNTSGTTTVSANTAVCGTGCTVTISGNDTAGLITVNTGTGVTAGTLGTVTFAATYGAAPRIVLTPETVPGSSTFPQYYYGVNATTFDLKAYNALSDSVTYTFSYHVIK